MGQYSTIRVAIGHAQSGREIIGSTHSLYCCTEMFMLDSESDQLEGAGFCYEISLSTIFLMISQSQSLKSEGDIFISFSK